MDGKTDRPPVIQMCDVFVDRQGLIFTTDHHAGLSIVEFDG